MTEDATYWAPLPADRYGQTSFSAPIAIKVRWEDKAELFLAPDGVQYTSAAVIYPDRELAIDGRIVYGASDAVDPRAVEGSFIIRQVQVTKNLRLTKKQVVAFL